jgi:coenzyme F420 hydrogenase subunit delta
LHSDGPRQGRDKMSEESLPEYVQRRVLVLGVGNVLFGDDGFGPAAADYLLKNCEIPKDVHVMDVGTGAGDILFTVGLSSKKPERVIILDAVDVKKRPAEIFQLKIEDLPESKLTDFSLHLFPSSNLLRELRDQMNIDIVIIACQAERVPDSVSMGLSESVRKALPKAAQMTLKLAQERTERKTD